MHTQVLHGSPAPLTRTSTLDSSAWSASKLGVDFVLGENDASPPNVSINAIRSINLGLDDDAATATSFPRGAQPSPFVSTASESRVAIVVGTADSAQHVHH